MVAREGPGPAVLHPGQRVLITKAGGSNLSPALFFERNNVIGRTIKNITQFFQSKEGDVLILFQRVQGLVVNAGLQ